MRLIDRKEFLVLLPALLGSAVLWLWWKSVGRDKSIHQKKLRIYFDEGTEFSNEKNGVIFIRKEGVLKAYDAHCTHLGCKLNVFADGRIQCPCHGSEFSFEGKVQKGPAKNDLLELPVFYDAVKKKYYTEIVHET